MMTGTTIFLGLLFCLLPPSDPTEDYYISLPTTGEIRRLDKDTGVLEPFASGMQIPYYGEWGADGFLYMPDSSFDIIWKIDASGNKQPLAIGAPMQFPITVAIDQEGWIGNAGDLFVTDLLGNQILQIDPQTGLQSIFVDNSSGLFDGPGGLGFDLDGNLYVGNVNSIPSSIIKITPDGTPSLFFMDYAAGLDESAGIQADGAGNLYVPSYANNTILRIRTDSKEWSVFSNDPLLSQPNDLKLDNSGGLLVTSAITTNLVHLDALGQATLIQQDGTYGGWFGVAVPEDFPRCNGRMLPYGTGTPGTGGFIPRWSGIFSPCPGTQVGFELDRALGDASGFVLWGVQAGSLPAWGGEILVAFAQPWGLFAINAPGSGAGAGYQRFQTVLPTDPGLTGLSIYEQILLFDPGAPGGISMSNGLEIQFGQ